MSEDYDYIVKKHLLTKVIRYTDMALCAAAARDSGEAYKWLDRVMPLIKQLGPYYEDE